MAEIFPRLLVATEFPPNASGGGAAIVRQMLKEWPVQNLFWWSCVPESSRHFGQQVAAHRVAHIPQKLYPHRRWCGQKSWLLENFWTPWAARHFRKTLEILKPDVVWVIPHCWAIPPLARILPSARIGFHVSIHDYADTNHAVASFGRVRSQRFVKSTEELYAAATTRDAICQPMVDDLRVRTNRPGTITRAGLESSDFEFLETKPENQTGEIRIAYAGTIAVEDTFKLFVTALKAVRRQFSRPVTLEFFGDHSYQMRGWFDPAWMREHGNLPPAQLTIELKKCTWGFSPMSLTRDDPRYNQFSLPTKFVSYLAAGLPIVALGHPESSVVKMATAHEVGVCFTSLDTTMLGTQLSAALSESNPGQKYREGILRCASAEFDARQMRAKLCENFRECSQHTVSG
jgi:hypothetical protein